MSEENPELTLVVLIENKSCSDEMLPEHGMSIYIEFNGVTALYDTGQTDLIIENSLAAGIAPSDIDIIAISHGHYDHTGGLLPLLKTNPNQISIYTGIGAFRQKYASKTDKPMYENGLPYPLEEIEDLAKEIIEVEGKAEIAPNMYLIGPAPFKTKFENVHPRMQLKDGEDYIPDDMADERSLVLDTSEGLVILTGCAHRGPANIVLDVKEKFPGKEIALILGGFHLGMTDEEELEEKIELFKNFNIPAIGLCHCTGGKATRRFIKEFPDNCFIAPTGTEIVF